MQFKYNFSSLQEIVYSAVPHCWQSFRIYESFYIKVLDLIMQANIKNVISGVAQEPEIKPPEYQIHTDISIDVNTN